MTNATLAITLLFSIFALRTKPGTAMGLIIACMMVWPEYLRISMGLAQMSTPRLVALVLIVKLLMLGRRKSLKLSVVDKLVIAGWLWTILATVAAGGEFSQVSGMIGRGFDTVLMYFVARFALMSVEDVNNMLMPLTITAFFMCAMGVLQAVTAYSLYDELQSFRNWEGLSPNKGLEMRKGFYRANVSSANSIFFGMAMMLIAGILFSIRGYGNASILKKNSTIAALIGAFTSFSSGPWVGCLLLVTLNAFVKRVSLIRPVLIFIFIFMLFLEIASNRHFYHLIDYLALDGKNAWYRTRLLEVAFSHWREYWLFGIGGDAPHHWASMIDGRGHIDVVNHFIILALYGGLISLIIYIVSHVVAVRTAVCAWRQSTDNRHRNMVFGFAATLIALDIASISVGLFGPALLLSYILLGFLVNTSGGVSVHQASSTK